MTRLRPPGRTIALLALAWLAMLTPAWAQASADLSFPDLSSRVVDQAGLLSPQAEAGLTARLEALERDTTDQVVVVTVDSLQGQEIEEYGYRLGRHWGIGQADKDNGLLLIVAPEERKVRIEVGYGLEPVMTDAMSALIIHNDILPAFREGEYERGIDQGVVAIDRQLRLDPAEAQARAAAAAAPRAEMPIGPIVIISVVLFLLFIGIIGGLSRGGRSRRGGVSPILIWAASEALRSSGNRRGGSSWGGGGFGGGGFGGGGGGFGGGGASGGW